MTYHSVNPCLEDVYDAANKDEEYLDLRSIIKYGFSNDKGQLPEQLRPYWYLRDRLLVEDSLILCGTRLVITKDLRKELQKLLRGHMGSTKTKQRARQVMWWPGIDVAITTCNTTKFCQPYQENFPSLPK